MALIQVLCDLANLKSSDFSKVTKVPNQFSSSVVGVDGSLVCEEC